MKKITTLLGITMIFTMLLAGCGKVKLEKKETVQPTTELTETKYSDNVLKEKMYREFEKLRFKEGEVSASSASIDVSIDEGDGSEVGGYHLYNKHLGYIKYGKVKTGYKESIKTLKEEGYSFIIKGFDENKKEKCAQYDFVAYNDDMVVAMFECAVKKNGYVANCGMSYAYKSADPTIEGLEVEVKMLKDKETFIKLAKYGVDLANKYEFTDDED